MYVVYWDIGHAVFQLLTLSAHAREGYNTQFVSQSFCHTDLEDGSLPKVETKHQDVAMDILSPFNVPEFLVSTYFWKKLSYFRPYEFLFYFTSSIMVASVLRIGCSDHQ